MNKEETLNRLLNAKQVLLSMQRHSWEHGTAMNAVLETGDMKTLLQMAVEAAYRRVADGRTAMVAADNAVTDPVSPGTGILASIDFVKANLEAIRGGKAPEETILGLCETDLLNILAVLQPAAEVDCRERGAVPERADADPVKRVRESHGRERAAVFERPAADVSHSAAEVDGSERGAALERAVLDGLERVG